MSEDKPRDPARGQGEQRATHREQDEALSEAELAQLDERPAVSALLKRSLARTEELVPEPKADAELLASVQRKLRKRSKGKFYGDGWSTSATRLSYALIAVVMLVTIAAVWFALGPTGFSLR